jgi:hypothetical protein
MLLLAAIASQGFDQPLQTTLLILLTIERLAAQYEKLRAGRRAAKVPAKESPKEPPKKTRKRSSRKKTKTPKKPR